MLWGLCWQGHAIAGPQRAQALQGGLICGEQPLYQPLPKVGQQAALAARQAGAACRQAGAGPAGGMPEFHLLCSGSRG